MHHPVDISQHETTRWVWLIHPILFSLYAVLAMLAANKGEIPLIQARRTLLALPLATALLLLILRALLRDWPRAALLTSVLVLINTSYGHVYTVLERIRIGALILGRHRFLLPLTAVLLGLAIWRIGFRRFDARPANRFLTLTAVVLLLFPAVNLTLYRLRIQAQGNPRTLEAIREQLQLDPAADAPLPDVYYIILDSYARSEKMLDYFGYDNTHFLDHLRSQGFYIAEQSHTNHNWTSLSLASSLNMTFAQDLGLDLQQGTYPGIFAKSIRRSLVRETLENLGYTTVALRSGYMNTELIDADIYLAPAAVDLERLSPPFSLNAFEFMLLRSSLGLVLWDLGSGDIQNWMFEHTRAPQNEMREIILYQIDMLAQVAAMPEPTFAFVHILSPHDPYFLSDEGAALGQDADFTFVEPPAASMGSKNATRYRNQALAISIRIQAAIDAILQHSDTTPIIFLQADHGSREALGWEDRSGPGMRQCMAILNAYLLPPQCTKDLYPSITPVNSFRVMFNCVYGGKLPLLEDRVYHSFWPALNEYKFTLVSDELD